MVYETVRSTIDDNLVKFVWFICMTSEPGVNSVTYVNKYEKIITIFFRVIMYDEYLILHVVYTVYT